MSESTKLGRRGFLGAGLVVVAGAGVGTMAVMGRQQVRWGDLRGYPDGPAELIVKAPSEPARAAVSVELRVTTPSEVVTFDAGTFRLRPGETARIPLTLPYPYDGFVCGRYAYEAVVQGPGFTWRTAEPASYEVREVAWFS